MGELEYVTSSSLEAAFFGASTTLTQSRQHRMIQRSLPFLTFMMRSSGNPHVYALAILDSTIASPYVADAVVPLLTQDAMRSLWTVGCKKCRHQKLAPWWARYSSKR